MKWFRRGRHRATRYSIRVTDLIPKPRCDFRDDSDRRCVLRPGHGHFHEIHPAGSVPYLMWKGLVRIGQPATTGFVTIAPPSGVRNFPALTEPELVAP